MGYEAWIPEELRDRPFRGIDAVAKGLLTKKQLRSSCWRRLFRGVYVWTGLELDSITRARAVELAAPRGAVISGRSAAFLWGVDLLRPNERLEITLARDQPMGPRDDVTIKRALVPDTELDGIEGVLLTSVRRTTFDLARRQRPGHQRDLVEAVVAIDAMAHQFWLNLDEFLAYSWSHRGWRGVRLVPPAVKLANRNAESPMETRLRLLLVQAGLPVPVVQHEVPIDGITYRIDLAYPKSMLAIEYDGRHHARRWTADLQRQNLLEHRGWRFRRYISTDYHQHPERIVHQVRTGLRRS